MKKIVFYDGDVKAFINGRKAVLLKFGPSELVLDGVLTKMFLKQDAKRGFEQIKRFISSASFEVMVLDGFAEALENSSFKEEIIIWLNDHQSNDDFPFIAITGGGKGKFPNLITE